MLLALLAGPAALHAFTPPFADTNSNTLIMTLAGEKAAGLMGSEISGLRMFAAPDGTPGLIPFQIDQKLDARRYVYDNAPGPRPAQLSRWDEILFMLKDCGPRLAKERWPQGADETVEFAVTHPDGRVGYAYLARFASPPPLPAKSYVTYDPERDLVSSSAWSFRFRKHNPLVFDDLVYKDLRGAGSNTIADGMRVRVKARSMGTMLAINKTEDDFKSRLTGYRAGPIRVIRDVEFSFDLGPIPLTDLYVRFEISQRVFDARVSFQFSTAISALVDDISAIIGVDYIDLKGITYSTLAVPEGRPITGSTEPSGAYVPYGKEEWFTLSGRGLYQITFLDFEPGLKLENNAYLRDGPDPYPPERFPGQFPYSGYAVTNWSNVGTKPRTFRIVISNLDGQPQGGGSGMYRLFRSPPSASAAKPGAPRVTIIGTGTEADRLKASLAAAGFDTTLKAKEATAADGRSDVYVLVGQPGSGRLRSSLHESRIPVIDWYPASRPDDPGENRRGQRLVIGGLPEPGVLARILTVLKPGTQSMAALGEFDAGWLKDLGTALGNVRLDAQPKAPLPAALKDTVVLLSPELSPSDVAQLSAEAPARGLVLFALSRQAVDGGAPLGFTPQLEGAVQVLPSILGAWLKGGRTAELKDTRELVLNRAVVRAQKTQLPPGILQLARPVN